MTGITNTVFEVEEQNPAMAILPLGSTEQHSRHLPLATDTLLAENFCQAIGQAFNAFVLPALPITNCTEHQGKKGSVTLPPAVLANVVESIVENLIEQGFEKIVIFIGHGGIFSVQPLLRVMNRRYAPRAHVVRVGFEHMEAAAVAAGVLKSQNELHSGEMETSLMLHLHPELVKPELAVDFLPAVTRDALNYTGIWRLSPTGVWGEPTLATAEKGQILFPAMVSAASQYIHAQLGLLAAVGHRYS